jgi:dihydrofolate reductase
MGKIVGAINMTLDGFCDHTSMIADDEIHQHYTELLKNSGTVLYGRITYQLMEYWRTVLEKPTGNRSFDEFAVVIDRIPKIVFSKTLHTVDWPSAHISQKSLKEEVEILRQKEGQDILAGSRTMIVTLLDLGLIDELQLMVQPIIAGKGLPLFENINQSKKLKLLKIKTFNSSGSVCLYYHA